MIRPRFAKILVASLLALAGMAFVPTASAQQSVVDTLVQLELTPYDSPIKPLSGLGIIPGKVTYKYSSNGASLLATTINLKVTDAPSWAAVTISPATIQASVLSSPQTSGEQTSGPYSFNVLVSTTADAPAFTPANIKISATAAPNGNLKQSTAEESTPIRADYYSIVDAIATTTIQTATPQSEVAYPITISNFGNQQTKVFFEVTQKPETWQVVAPPPFTLDSKQAGGKNTQQTINLMIQTPFRNGYLNEVGTITMKITSKYALDAKVPGDTTEVSTLTTTRGFYVPGFEPVLLIAMLGGLALVVRARR